VFRHAHAPVAGCLPTVRAGGCDQVRDWPLGLSATCVLWPANCHRVGIVQSSAFEFFFSSAAAGQAASAAPRVQACSWYTGSSRALCECLLLFV
jgi:hypothetical protein